MYGKALPFRLAFLHFLRQRVERYRMPEDDQQEINRKSGLAYAAALSLFAAVAAGLVLGWLLDRWLGTRPWLLVAGLVLGAAVGFYEFIRASSKL
jgi:ATP synthase protein I